MGHDLAGPPLAIVGPTASGKSALSMALATDHPGTELLSVDSMQVYRGMDIGTAKPSPDEQRRVPHHLLNLVEPSDEFDLATFQRRARAAMAAVEARRGRLVAVGGTALYLRAVIDDLDLPGQYPDVRADLDTEPDTEALHERLTALDPVAAGRMEPTNRRRVLRALEVTLGAGRPFSSFGPGLATHPPTPFRIVGLRWDLGRLDERIAHRFDRQLDAGFLDEVRRIDEAGMSRTAGQALGYRELRAHLRGECSLDDAVAEAVTRTRRFARRQLKWLRRDPRVEWFDADDPDLVASVHAVFHGAVAAARPAD